MSSESAVKNKGRFSGERLADFCVLLVLVVFVAWYLLDTYTASTHIMNLILVLPLAVLVLILCATELLTQLKKPLTTALGVADEKESFLSVAPVMALFTAYVLSLHWLGFDVGTFAFIALFLWLHGEKRIVWVLAYSLAFSILVALFFSKMLPYPMPMLLFPSGY